MHSFSRYLSVSRLRAYIIIYLTKLAGMTMQFYRIFCVDRLLFYGHLFITPVSIYLLFQEVDGRQTSFRTVLAVFRGRT